MTVAVLMLAAALSAGNAEFENGAREAAATIAVNRLAKELSEKGLDAGVLEAAMLSDPATFKNRAEAERRCRDLYREAFVSAYGCRVDKVLSDLDMDGLRPRHPEDGLVEAALAKHYGATFARERTAACVAQAKTIALKVKPDESDLESKGDDEVREWLTSRIASARGLQVFEENLKYISEKIVDPILADARKERKRQQEYLMRTRAESVTPTALAAELEANLRKNVAERKAKCEDPQRAWNVFPRILREDLPVAVTRRILSAVSKEIEAAPFAIEANEVLEVIAADPPAHRKAQDSERIFRDRFAQQLLADAFRRVEESAPSAERTELVAFLKEQATAPELMRTVEARMKRELIPKWKIVRAEVAAHEVERLWPTLADRTWYPEADFADRTVARSDYAAALKAWRTASELKGLATEAQTLEESDDAADQSVAKAFDLARTAITAQNEIVARVHPPVLTAARDLSKGLFAKKPDLASVTEMLTKSVQGEWTETRETILWKDDRKPANAGEQHVGLFPSVKRRIELEARQILEELVQQEAKEEESAEEPEEELCTISFKMSGGEVTVQAKRGNAVVAERKAKATAKGFEDAVREVGGVVGREIFRLK